MNRWVASLCAYAARWLRCPTIVLRFRGTGYRKKKETTNEIRREPSPLSDEKEMFGVYRTIFTNESTIGEFRVDNEFLCWTLEDTCRKNKIPHQTAIPPGRYEIVLRHSEKWKQTVPWLLEVPNFTNIQIHPGNSKDDTSGCILVGMRKGENMIYDSRKAFELVKKEILKKMAAGPIYMLVTGGR